MTAPLTAACAVALPALALVGWVVLGAHVVGVGRAQWQRRRAARTARATPWCARCGSRVGDVIDRGACPECEQAEHCRRAHAALVGWPASTLHGGCEARSGAMRAEVWL